MIKSYDKFCSRLVERFDRKDPEEHFRELAHLKQKGSVKDCVAKFKRLSVMVIDISEKRLIVLFIEGLVKQLEGLVKAFHPQHFKRLSRKLLINRILFPSRNKNPKYRIIKREIPKESLECSETSCSCCI